MIVGRKRSLLIEKLSSITKIESQLPFNNIQGSLFNIIPYHNEYYRKNRFVVELENDFENIKIESFKIQSFNMSNQTIHIKALLKLEDWIEDFKKVKIAKISLFDSIGNVVRYFDYDIVLIDYNIDFNYTSDDIMCPDFSYKIVK